MSYGRNPCYIYSDGEHMRFVTDGMVDVSEDHINALLYKLLLANRRDELRQRLLDGRDTWRNKRWRNEGFDDTDNAAEQAEHDHTIRWMESQEDELFKRLVGLEEAEA